MKRPLGLWISAIFALLVALAMVGNLLGMVLAEKSTVEGIIRPATLLTVSTASGVLHLLWAQSAWRVSRRALPLAVANLAFLLSLGLLFALAPTLFVDRAYADSFFIRPPQIAKWSAIYILLIGTTYIYHRRGRLA